MKPGRQSHVIAKYLSRWAEPLAQDLSWESKPYWDRVIVLPLFDESTAWIDAIPSPRAANQRLLIVAVVNASADAEDAAIERTRALHNTLNGLPLITRLGPGAVLVRQSNLVEILVCDCISPGRLVADGGVGLARKLGCDIALSAFAHGCLGTSWLATSDGDVIDYSAHVEAQATTKHEGAMLLPFRHEAVNDSRLTSMHQLYELTLWHYVLGLASAGSNYAFHTIGSTMVIHAASYAQVRGFPKRSGAEDFHMLNKLRKVGPVHTLDSQQVPIRCRSSTRVPFGTGPAVTDLLAAESVASKPLFYDPRAFRVLAKLLHLCRQSAFASATMTLRQALAPLKDDFGVVSILESWGADKARNTALSQSQTETHFLRQWHTWFDALKTLRLVHVITASGLPKVSIEEVVRDGLTLSPAADWTEMLQAARQSWQAKGYAQLGAAPLH